MLQGLVPAAAEAAAEAHEEKLTAREKAHGVVKGGKLAVVAVTSIYLPQLRVCQLRDGCSLTLFARPLQLPLRAYYDGDGTPPEWAPSGVTWVSLDAVAPWAGQFARENRARNSTVQTAYRRKQLRCIVRDSFNKTGLCLDVMTVLKTASIHDAVFGCRDGDGDGGCDRQSAARHEPRPLAKHVVWLDFDTFFQQPLDTRFWAWAGKYDVTTIGAKVPHNPETGVLVLDATSVRARRLLRLTRLAYTTPALRQAAGGVNDVQIFGLLLNQLAGGAAPAPTTSAAGLTVGWFAVGCRKLHSREPWLVDSLLYEAYQYQLCPSEAPNVSPFNLFEYVTHVKRKAGPIATTGGLHGRFRRGLPSSSTAPGTSAGASAAALGRLQLAAKADASSRGSGSARKTGSALLSVCTSQQGSVPSWCQGLAA
tara:strand:- start:1841 stop:3109 length:1269 start_codon:yes stop_codon:yes gene_type:complete